MVVAGIKKLAGAAVTIFGASIISFVLLRILPGDPARLIAGPLAPASAVEAVYRQLGLDQPIHIQYYRYISAFVRGDWGFSFSSGTPVREIISTRLPATIELALYAFVIAITGAILLALLATYRRQPALDRIVRSLSSFGQGVPSFWFALLSLMLFFEFLGILPGPDGRLDPRSLPPLHVTGLFTVDALLSGRADLFWEALTYLILPTVSLALPPFAFLVRLLRANLLEVSREPFILVVRSKGISRWVTFLNHALPNAFLPTLTASGLVLAELLTGSVLIEKIFSWPGVGSLVVDSILRQDYAVAQAFFLLSATAYVVVNMAIDFLYGAVDPRTRVAQAESA
jgi:ABC-type dipeptide/oligopeptide/nickel transport system permease component